MRFADLSEAPTIDPDHVDAPVNRALACRKKGDADAVRDDLDRAKALEARHRRR